MAERWLAGACGWNGEREQESSKGRAERERAEQEQREPRASKTKKGFDVAAAATASKML